MPMTESQYNNTQDSSLELKSIILSYLELASEGRTIIEKLLVWKHF